MSRWISNAFESLMWPEFPERSHRAELIDDLDHDPETLRVTIEAVERVNRCCGGIQTSLRGLESLMSPGTRQLSILDVGTGNGALPAEFVQWGRARDIDVEAHGIDLIGSSIDEATRRHRDVEGLTFARRDLFKLDGEDRYDIVHASLLLHHFFEGDEVDCLRQMARLSRVGIVVNDLHRHPLHYLGAQCLIPMVTRDRLARHDGPISVSRGFTRPELRERARRAGLDHVSIAWRPPFRWLLVAPTG